MSTIPRQFILLAEGAELLVVAIPPRIVVEEPSPETFVPEGQPAGHSIDLLHPERILGQFLRDARIEHLLLAEPLRADRQQAASPLYFPNDGHLNVQGHRCVATHALSVLAAKIRAMAGRKGGEGE